VLILIAVAAVDCFLVATPNYWYVIRNPESDVQPPPGDGFHQVRQVGHHHELNYARSNAGVTNCYEFKGIWPTSVKGYGRRNYHGEQYLSGLGNVQLEKWSPNVLEYDLDAPAPSDLVINQNYDPSWRLTSGTGQVFDLGEPAPAWLRDFASPGLLAVHVPAGHQRVQLRYRSASLVTGIAISLGTLFLSVGLWFIERRKPVTTRLRERFGRWVGTSRESARRP
jgi:hypothetical protein